MDYVTVARASLTILQHLIDDATVNLSAGTLFTYDVLKASVTPSPLLRGCLLLSHDLEPTVDAWADPSSNPPFGETWQV